MDLIIAGLRKSGTTVVWETFRQDKRLLCFDEPFHDYILKCLERKKNNTKKTFDEYLKHSEFFKKNLVAIPIKEETIEGLTEKQKEYYNKLLNLSENICMDVTRCNLKLNDLKRKDSFVVLLIRQYQGWVTSQLRDKVLKEKIFEHKDSFDYYGYQQIAESLNINDEYSYKALMKTWGYLNQKTIEAKPDYILSYELFCDKPEYYVKQIYDKINIDYKQLDYSHIKEPDLGFNPTDKRWEINGNA